MLGQTSQTDPEASVHSAHLAHFSQIRLEVREEKEKECNSLNRGNELNGLKEVKRPPTGITPCFTCKGFRFWLSIHGAPVCAGCHPPAHESLVESWIIEGEETK